MWGLGEGGRGGSEVYRVEVLNTSRLRKRLHGDVGQGDKECQRGGPRDSPRTKIGGGKPENVDACST